MQLRASFPGVLGLTRGGVIAPDPGNEPFIMPFFQDRRIIPESERATAVRIDGAYESMRTVLR